MFESVQHLGFGMCPELFIQGAFYAFEKTSGVFPTVLAICGWNVLGYPKFRLVNCRSCYSTRELGAFSWEKSEGADLKDFMGEFYLILLQTAFGLKCVVMS